MYHTLSKVGIAALVGLAALSAQAGVSAEEAAKLKSELTPFGAERAGNKDDSIPAWTGGVAKPGELTGRRPDPFAGEKPLFSITAKNAAQYADKLNEGNQALFKKYPDTYRIDVYKTQRTAAAPQWVYDNTFRNASQASTVESDGGPIPKGAYGGIPFPIPKNGVEIMWNHILRWRGEAVHMDYKAYQLTTDGRWIMVVDASNDMAMPFYFKEGNADSYQGEHWLVRAVNIGPPIRSGEGILGRMQLDESKSQSWVYLTGQRRIRKLPNPCCDTPSPFSAGVSTFDEVDVFSNRMDKFNWKLVGKQEMYIPYNGNKIQNAKSDAVILGSGRHLNPDELRWELHRVWVVEATLKPGQRHVLPKSRYYLDEDTWEVVLSDRWDANGQLARTGFEVMLAMPDLPGTVGLPQGVYDLISGSGFVLGLDAEVKRPYQAVPRQKDTLFSPDSLAAEGVR
ncbi:Protein of unknown function [Variovorax sp. HW608]|uniref:DUF1329 domain-containing protein n=1 Tax=Variovorax sp. HW608 TaxID=1034889 RepID=UPI00081FD656|nr:DUF1329 domain-containing protein [Variovorax sp. HW608]SCK14884.1 Protein of unknown function [Variovorax sp. HW608]